MPSDDGVERDSKRVRLSRQGLKAGRHLAASGGAQKVAATKRKMRKAGIEQGRLQGVNSISRKRPGVGCRKSIILKRRLAESRRLNGAHTSKASSSRYRRKKRKLR